MKLRIGVIGAGAWGINHVRALVAEPRCSVVRVVDPDAVARARVHGIAPHAELGDDANELITDPDIHAVIIASPAATHPALALAAMRAGKHVLVEKPVAMNVEAACEVERTARALGRVCLVGHLMLYHPAIVRLRELLCSGELGRMHYMQSTRVNLGRIRNDENALWSFGPHDISMIDFLVGELPESVAARGQCVVQPRLEDVVFLTLRYASGSLAHVHLSWLSPRKERRLTIVCSQKMVEFDDVSADKLRIYDKGFDRPPGFTEYGQYLVVRDGDVHIPQVVMTEPLQLQLQHFLDCVEGLASPLTDPTSAVRVTRVLAAAARSLVRDGEPVVVDANSG